MDLRTPFFPTWCPGCGDFGIWGSLKMAIAEMNIDPEKLVIVFDVGCSGNMADFIKVYGVHALHGRSIPVAEGISMVNHDLTVIVVGGDGGIYGEGMGHFISACKGNHNITLLVHDNQTYGLTKGQTSPTTSKGVKTSSTPGGVIEEPINPIALAITSGASWVGRSYAANIPLTKDLIIKAVKHDGFSVLDIFQPCVTFNKLNTQAWFMSHIVNIESDYLPNDRLDAWKLATSEEKLPIGIFYENNAPSYAMQLPQLETGTLIAQFSNSIDLSAAMNEYR